MDFFDQEELKKMHFHSIEALQAFLDQKRHAYNNSGTADFEGISPMQMRYFLYNPFNEGSPLTINKVSDAIFQQMPFFLTVETLLQIVLREGTVKLTPKGNLPLKICSEIADKKYWIEDLSHFYKMRKEEDFLVIHTAKIMANIGGLTRKANGKLNVTKNAQKILEKNDRNALFQIIFQTFMTKFNWGYHDLYQSHQIGPIGWSFSIYLLDKFGDEQYLSDFYAQKYFTAFPFLIETIGADNYSTPLKRASDCYKVRSFARYFNWFGFVHFPEKKSRFDRENDKLLKTEVVDALFSFKID